MGNVVQLRAVPAEPKNPAKKGVFVGMRRTTFDDVSRFLFDPDVTHCVRQELLNNWRKTWGLEPLRCHGGEP